MREKGRESERTASSYGWRQATAPYSTTLTHASRLLSVREFKLSQRTVQPEQGGRGLAVVKHTKWLPQCAICWEVSQKKGH
jgi:hypothetical protein